MTEADTDQRRDTAIGEMSGKLEGLSERMAGMERKVDRISEQLNTYNGAQKALLWLAGAALAVGGWFAHSFSSVGK